MQPLTPHTATERGYVLVLLYRLQALQDQLNAGLMTQADYHAHRDDLRDQARHGITACRERVGHRRGEDRDEPYEG